MKNILTLFAILFFATTAFSQDNSKQEPTKSAVEIWRKQRMEAIEKMRERQFNNERPFPNSEKPNFNWGTPNFNSPYYGFGTRPPVGYMPMIMWVPQGMHMGVGPVMVSPDRRYVRFGINASFYHIPEVHTFNFYTGQSGRVR